ncbi:caltractin-like [Chiloscyllium plagiosum]|uniref:caltractin-like n=1 Tax=Chiloscyllium plagiosum TaxID=36176 RepID=UPI001CB83F81|nr:caltractin-like [Chiloscyllium plagiosum]
MPPKKKTFVKRKKKKVTKKETQKTSENNKNLPEPLKADFVPSPSVLREKILTFLQEWKDEQQEMAKRELSDKIHQELTAQDIRDLRLVFDTTDTRNAGYLNSNEVCTALQTLGFLVNQHDLKKTMRNLKLSKEEGVSFSDFLQIVMEHQGDSRDTYEEIKLGFSLFDCDGDGKITFDNLKDACKSAGVHFSHHDLREMIKEVDTNGDGTVDMEEFINLMLQTNLF